MPHGETPQVALLQAITPWLDEARVTRQTVKLRHGPEGADELDQRGCLVAPLVAQQSCWASCTADLEGLFGRLHEGDRDLLATLAAQAAVALANLHTQEGLERTVAERTAQLEQRAGELALINSIQQGIASKLDFQSVVEMVGDKLREVFKTDDMSIRWWDAEANTLQSLYSVEHGRHLPKRPPWPVKPGTPVEKLLRTGVGGWAGTREEQLAIGIPGAVPGTDWCLSIMAAPIRGAQRVLGSIVLEDHEREHAYGEADLRVLTTIGATLGQALENARLFDETQRLLKETEARNAELAVINSIQQGLAGQLDFQAIADLVGDKLRQVLAADLIGIALLDRERAHFSSPYLFDQGRRYTPQPWPVHGIGARVVRSLQPAVFATHADAHVVSLTEGAGTQLLGSQRPPESTIYMPLVSGGTVIGLLVVGKLPQAAFSTADVNLVATIAASLSVALANARSFAAERQRAAELAIINAVQQALAGELDIQGVYDAVGEKLLEVFPRSMEGIRIVDRASGRMLFPYCVAHGKRVHPLPGQLTDRGFGAEVIRTGHTLLVNENMEEVARRLGSAGTIMGGPGSPRSLLLVPLIVAGQVNGMLVLNDMDREHAFSPDDVRLLETLAASMSVALENARLFDETQRLLKETERRSAELAVINTIQQGMARELNLRAIVELVGDKLREVFASNDLSIHGANMTTLDAQALYVVERGERVFLPDYKVDPSQPIMQRHLRGEVTLARNPSEIAQVMGLTVETLDTELEQFPGTHQSKTIVWVPINPTLERSHVLVLESADREDAFSEADIGLLQTVAASMGMALENARLFSETQAALQRQTASADILRVISQSPTDVMPVAEVIVATARRLLGCYRTAFLRREGEVLVALRHATAGGVMPGMTEKIPLDPAHNFPSRVLASGALLHIPDWSAIELSEHERRIREATGCQASLMLPLLRGASQEPLGVLVFQRDTATPFSETDIALAQSFADQAVIAIENVRLFNETQEALERQTASAEVLQVISGSVADTQPVFERILACTARLFGTDEVMLLTLDDDGGRLHLRGHRGAMAEAASPFFPIPLAGTGTEVCLRERRVVRFDDAMNGADSPPAMRDYARQLGFSWSEVEAPLISDGRGIGSIMVFRRDLRPFTDAEARMLQTFADQAVIAIQNAQLFNDTKDALERQTATAEVLKVIAQSPDDVQPVLDAIVASARRLVDAYSATIWRLEGTLLRLVAFTDTGEHGTRVLQQFSGGYPLDDSYSLSPLRTGQPSQMADVLTDPRATEPHRELARLRGFRAVSNVPLVRDGAPIGIISVTRAEAGEFTPHQIELLQTFADQAVIAIENVRLFNETQALQRDAGSAGAADGHVRRAAGHQRITHRCAAGVRHHCREGRSPDAVALRPGDPGRGRLPEPGQHARQRPRGGGPGAPGLAAAAGPELPRCRRVPSASGVWSTWPTCRT